MAYLEYYFRLQFKIIAKNKIEIKIMIKIILSCVLAVQNRGAKKHRFKFQYIFLTPVLKKHPVS